MSDHPPPIPASFDELPRPPIEVEYTRPERGTKGRVVFRDGEKTRVDRVDIFDGPDRMKLVSRLKRSWPELNDDSARAEAVLERLELFAASQLQVAAVTTAFKDGEEPEYFANDTGMFWRKQTKDGPVDVRLTHFIAHIVSQLTLDDGTTTRIEFEIAVTCNGRSYIFSVSAEEFGRMTWPLDHIGGHAVVEPGNGLRDRARVAIQLLSKPIKERRVYLHLGWIKIDDRWAYLHAGGAIGAENIEVRLDAPLDRFELPAPPSGDDRISAVRASLRFLDIADDWITFPCYAALWRSVLGEPADLALWILGPSGVQKSELLALLQSHFGRVLSRTNLPTSWESTANSNEELAFLAKDTFLAIDDFAPQGGDAERLQKEAARILRAQGNRSGRGRLTRAAARVPGRPPRGLIGASGEDLPKGHSLRARLYVVQVAPGSVRLEPLTSGQSDAATGLYSRAMAAFVEWLAFRRDRVQDVISHTLAEARNRLRDLSHARNPDQVAQLLVGIDIFLEFAVAIGALDLEAACGLRNRAWTSLVSAARAQSEHLITEAPAARFLSLLVSVLESGDAYLLPCRDSESAPQLPQLPQLSESVAGRERKGTHIGWNDENGIYLNLDAALGVVCRLARTTGHEFTVTPTVLRKRLYESDALASTEKSGNGNRYDVKKMVAPGERLRVLHLHPDLEGLVEKLGHLGQLGREPSQPPDPPPWCRLSLIDAGGPKTSAHDLDRSADSPPETPEVSP